jgi:hypothetical protein
MFDSMDARTAFKLGFLTKCAEDGVSPEELQTRIKAAGFVADAAKAMFSVPGALMLGALPVGFGAGYVAADAFSTPTESVDDVKRKELMEAYRRATDRANRVAQRMQTRHSQQPRMPRLPSSVLG